ncbi:MAG: DNA alkylation repair protein [Verrucomicrobia bacterium]|nr:DNA alkylation repair protein [Verrucomicrobiota bacterium]
MRRFGIPSEHALGVRVSDLHRFARHLGRSHELCQALWPTGLYEARMLVAFVGEPERLSLAQMEAWCRDFDSWALTDTLCCHLFDRTPLAWDCVPAWATREPEFEKRAAFALIASLARHDDLSSDTRFLDCLPLIEAAASDPRNFVKKGVSWALRGLGGRNAKLLKSALALAKKLAASREPSARWVGKDAQRYLAKL